MVNPAYIIFSTVDKIAENFLFTTISPIVGKANYEIIARVHFKLNSNSVSVQSNLRDGKLGLLYLTVSAAVYNTLSATVFILPVNPGATAIITDDATTAVIANKRRSFANATALFKQYEYDDKYLKQMLLGDFDEIFIRSLQTKYVEYLNLSTSDILNNLYSD